MRGRARARCERSHFVYLTERARTESAALIAAAGDNLRGRMELFRITSARNNGLGVIRRCDCDFHCLACVHRKHAIKWPFISPDNRLEGDCSVRELASVSPSLFFFWSAVFTCLQFCFSRTFIGS